MSSLNTQANLTSKQWTFTTSLSMEAILRSSHSLIQIVTVHFLKLVKISVSSKCQIIFFHFNRPNQGQFSINRPITVGGGDFPLLDFMDSYSLISVVQLSYHDDVDGGKILIKAWMTLFYISLLFTLLSCSLSLPAFHRVVIYHFYCGFWFLSNHRIEISPINFAYHYDITKWTYSSINILYIEPKFCSIRGELSNCK